MGKLGSALFLGYLWLVFHWLPLGNLMASQAGFALAMVMGTDWAIGWVWDAPAYQLNLAMFVVAVVDLFLLFLLVAGIGKLAGRKRS